jgi:hypothetical protein
VRSIAILKCLGGRPIACSRSHGAGAGARCRRSALGVALAAAVIAAVPSFVGGAAGSLQIDYGLSASAVGRGLAIGVLVSLLFSVVRCSGPAGQALAAAPRRVSGGPYRQLKWG